MDNKKPNIPDCGDFTSSKCTLVDKKSALNATYREYTFQSNSFTMLPEELLDDTKECIEQILNNYIENKVFIKAYSTMQCIFNKIHVGTREVNETITSYFSTKAVPIQCKGEIDDYFEGEKKKFDYEVENFTNKGSNWILNECKTLTIRLVKFNPGNNYQDDDSDDSRDSNDDEWRLYN